jgi:hypothetical protein
MSACTPEQTRLVFVDYRRSLLELTGSEHSIGYATSSVAAARLLDDVREALAGRLPPPDLPLAQLRSRSWWSGAESSQAPAPWIVKQSGLASAGLQAPRRVTQGAEPAVINADPGSDDEHQRARAGPGLNRALLAVSQPGERPGSGGTDGDG